MMSAYIRRKAYRCLVKAAFTGAMLVVLGGCSTTLVDDPARHTVAVDSHCSGSQWVDDSSVAVLPIPVVAFFTPHADLNGVQADQLLSRCGESDRLANRKVEVSKLACIPAGLSRIITLGIWQWCPVHASWEADVLKSGQVAPR